MKRLIVAVLPLVVIFFASCQGKKIQELQDKNASLNSQVDTLKQQIAKLKETAQYHFQQGQKALTAGDFPNAIDEFNKVIKDYPNDPLVSQSKKSLAIAQKQQAIEAKKKAREAAIAKEKKEKEIEERGEPIDYMDFFAKAKIGLPVGKRYRLTACLYTGGNTDGSLMYAPDCNAHSLGVSYEDADENEYMQFLKGQSNQVHTIVAAMGADGQVHILKIE